MKKGIVVLCLAILVAGLGSIAILRRQRALSTLEEQSAWARTSRSVAPAANLSEHSTSAVPADLPKTPLPLAPNPVPPDAEPSTLNAQKFWREVEDRAKKNFEEALFWARGFKSEDARDKAFSILSLCLLGVLPDSIDIPRAIVLASEIRDTAIRLNTQGQIAAFWAGWKPEQAMSWAQFLPEKETPRTPPADERERVYWYDYDSREKILLSCIRRWTMWDLGPSNERAYPEAKVEAARRWIADAPLGEATKKKMLAALPKKP